MSDKSIEKDYEALKADIAQLRSDLSSLLNTVKESGTERVQTAKSEAAEKIRQGTDKAARKAEEVGERIEAQYTERPLIFMLAAFVVGIVLGRIFKDR